MRVVLKERFDVVEEAQLRWKKKEKTKWWMEKLMNRESGRVTGRVRLAVAD